LYVAVVSLLRRLVGADVNIGRWFASTWMGLIIVGSLAVGVLPVAESKNPSKTLQEPVLARPDLFSRHPLGTDRQGLDMLGGVLYGLRTSLIIGLGVVFLGMLIGGTIGLIAGYNRGRLDQGLEFFTNSMLAFPPLILLMGVAAVMERNVVNITLALTVVSVPTYIRLARANTMVVGQREFVLAARALGLRNRTILAKDVAPNVMKPLLSYAFVVTAVIIVAEASLSFLGLGIPRPEPTLGNMIASGQSDFETIPHLVFVPATALFLTVLSLNRMGEEAQQRWAGS
jgi:peptide/nickel transport system permease protein